MLEQQLMFHATLKGTRVEVQSIVLQVHVEIEHCLNQDLRSGF